MYIKLPRFKLSVHIKWEDVDHGLWPSKSGRPCSHCRYRGKRTDAGRSAPSSTSQLSARPSKLLPLSKSLRGLL